MINFILKRKMAANELGTFVAHAARIDPRNVICISLDEFNSSGPIDGFECICVFSQAHGDAEQMVQLYRYGVGDEVIIGGVIEACATFGVGCYIPTNGFDEWLYVEGALRAIVVRRDSPEEDFFFSRKPAGHG